MPAGLLRRAGRSEKKRLLARVPLLKYLIALHAKGDDTSELGMVRRKPAGWFFWRGGGSHSKGKQ